MHYVRLRILLETKFDINKNEFLVHINLNSKVLMRAKILLEMKLIEMHTTLPEFT